MAGEKSVRLSILGDNTDAKLKLDEIDEKADALAEEHPELKIGIDTAAAQAKLAILRSELESVKEESASTIIDAESAKAIGAAGLGIAAASAAIPVIATLGAAVVGVSMALVPAGIGLGLFGAVAKSAVTQVEAADTANKKLSGGLGELQSGLNGAKAAWDGFVSKESSGVAATLGHAFQLIPDALKQLAPILPPVESALDGIITKLGTGLKSSGFGEFISEVADEAPQAITDLATIFGHLGDMAGKAFTQLMPFGAMLLDDITKLSGKADDNFAGGLTKFMGYLSAHGGQVGSDLENLGKAVVGISKGLGGMSGVTIAVLTPLTSFIRIVASHPIGADALAGLLILTKLSGLTAIIGPLGKLGGLLFGLVDAEKAAAAGGVLMDLAFGPVGIILLALGAAALIVATHWNFFKGVAIDVFKGVTDAVTTAFNWISEHWKLLATILATVLLGPVAGLVVFLATHWSQVTSDVSKLITNVVGFFTRLPGQIMSAVAALPGEMLSFGENIIKGLIGGIENAVGGLLSTVSGIAGDVSSAFSSVLGIFSPSRVFMEHGKNIVLGLVQGVDSNSNLATQSITRMASGAVNAGNSRIAMASSASSTATTAEWIGGAGADQEFITWLKKNIRVRGGNPAILGR